MRTEYQDLLQVDALTVKDAALNAHEVIDTIKEQKDQLVDEVESKFKSSMIECMNYAMMHAQDNTPIHYQEDTQPVEVINQTSELDTLRKQITTLQLKLRNLENNKDNQPRFRQRQTSPSLQNQNNFHQQQWHQNQRQYSYTQSRPQYKPKLYCWTHGAGSHDGWGCNNPAHGHQPAATFRDRMGGSNYRCRTVHFNSQFQTHRRNAGPTRSNYGGPRRNY